MKNDPVKSIIDGMALPVVRQHRNLKGVDLQRHEKSFRRLIGEIWMEHELALEDWMARADPDKPNKHWDKNDLLDVSGYDYSQFVAEDHDVNFLKEWAAHYQTFYSRSAANPRRSRSADGRPLAPLYAVYFPLREWWKARYQTWSFSLRADIDPDTATLKDMGPALRAFYLVGRSCNPEYSIVNCLSVHDYAKSLKRRTKKAAEGRNARRAAKRTKTVAKPRFRTKADKHPN